MNNKIEIPMSAASDNQTAETVKATLRERTQKCAEEIKAISQKAVANTISAYEYVKGTYAIVKTYLYDMPQSFQEFTILKALQVVAVKIPGQFMISVLEAIGTMLKGAIKTAKNILIAIRNAFAKSINWAAKSTCKYQKFV